MNVKILADSVAPNRHRMTTLEIEYPRFILAELNTHRMLSKNSSSSRAIPQTTMLNQLLENPATPWYWGKNMPGMSAKEEVSDPKAAQALWFRARDSAISIAKLLYAMGVHKQVTNRVTEPWMIMKTVISGTEWANFRYLRDHPDAQPEFKVLARMIGECLDNSTPQELQPGMWHLPYVRVENGQYFSEDKQLTLEQAIKLSVSCCAQVSYRSSNSTLEKAEQIYDRLNLDSTDSPKHASPTEHQATPISCTAAPFEPETWPNGVSHVSANGDLWSGNLRGWIQFRKTISGESKW